MVFYRKYRPQKFSDIVGQKHVVSTLLSQLSTGKVSHGYLFSGPKGTGKTTIARLMAKAVNCQVYSKSPGARELESLRFGEPCNKCISCKSVMDGSHLDLIEIDAASNRNIDDVRDLREKIKSAPVAGRFKVYIIDEVHMLTREAFNALLKTLEEPPKHAIFILATTEIAKLPQTIISRVQKFNFKRASEAELSEAIVKIAKAESIKIEQEAVKAIVKAADGSFRDAVSTLDQLSALKSQIKKADVHASTILLGWDETFELTQKLLTGDLKGSILKINSFVKSGGDVSFLNRELVLILEKILFLKIGLDAQNLELSEEEFKDLSTISDKITTLRVQNLIKLLMISEGEMKLYPMPQIPLVLAVVKFASQKPENVLSSQPVIEEKAQPEFKDHEISDAKVTKLAPKVLKSKNLGQIEAKWSEFLNKVKPVNTHITAILRSTRPVSLENGTLTLEAFYRFHKEKLEEPKVIQMLEGHLRGVVGSDITLKFTLANRMTKPPIAVVKSDVIDIDNAKLEKLSTEIGEIFSK